MKKEVTLQFSSLVGLVLVVLTAFQNHGIYEKQKWSFCYEIIDLENMEIPKIKYSINQDSIYIRRVIFHADLIKNETYYEEELLYKNVTLEPNEFEPMLQKMQSLGSVSSKTFIVGGFIILLTLKNGGILKYQNCKPKEIAELDSLINLSVEDEKLRIK